MPDEEIKNDFKNALSELTFNSRPIITSLTMIASENIQAAVPITAAIHEQILDVVPNNKLPLIYLMDSILKNVGGIFQSTFADVVVSIFKHSFEAMNRSDRSKLVKVLKTWRAMPGRTSVPIFSNALLDEMEKYVAHQSRMELSQGSVSKAYVPGSKLAPPVSLNQKPQFEIPIQNKQVITQITSLLQQKQTFSTMYPNDTVVRNQITTLGQLLHLASTTPLDSQSLTKISAEISGMMMNNQVKNLNISNGPLLTTATQLPPIRLNSDDLNIYYPGSISIIYDSIQLQCKQCGLRYYDSEIGKSVMEDHLDWHFRSNRRAKDASKRALSRGWYHTTAGWITENDPVETILHDEESAQESITEVNIPAEGEETAKCATCLEPLFKFYDEKLEEWMLKNAVKENDQFYHIDCARNRSGASSVLGKRKENPSE